MKYKFNAEIIGTRNEQSQKEFEKNAKKHAMCSAAGAAVFGIAAGVGLAFSSMPVAITSAACTGISVACGIVETCRANGHDLFPATTTKSAGQYVVEPGQPMSLTFTNDGSGIVQITAQIGNKTNNTQNP